MLAYIAQEYNSGQDGNDQRGERPNKGFTDTIIGTDRTAVTDQEKGQTEARSIDQYYYRHSHVVIECEEHNYYI